MDSEIGLAFYLRVVLMRWKSLLAVTLLGGAAFALPALRAVPQYEATATLLVVPFNANVAGLATTRVRVLLDNNGIAADLVREFELDRRYGLSADRFRQDHVSVQEVRPTTMLRVRVRLPDSGVAADVANAFCVKAVSAAQQLQAIEIEARRDQGPLDLASLTPPVEIADRAVPPDRPLVMGALLSAMLGAGVTWMVASGLLVLWQELRRMTP